jgi:hypothetical protein
MWSRAAADEAALGGDHEVVRVRVQGLADELLVGVRAVDVGGVDVRDAHGHGLAQERNTLVVIGVLAPDLRSGQLHRPVADARDGQVAPDRHGVGDVRDWAHFEAPFPVRQDACLAHRS